MKIALLHLPEGIKTSIGDWLRAGCCSRVSEDISIKLNVSQLLEVASCDF